MSKAPGKKVDWSTVNKSRISISAEDDEYEATWDGHLAATMSLYEDDQGKYWLNHITTEPAFQGNGIGLALLNRAVEDYGAIYAATYMHPNEAQSEGDSRHLSTEGAALVSSAVRNGILKEEWCFNPASGPNYDDY